MSLQKKIQFAGIALLPVLACCLEVPLLLAEMSIYDVLGIQPMRYLWQSILHWSLTCTAWGATAYGVIFLSKKQGFDILALTDRPGKRQMLYLGLIMIAGIAFMSSTWEFQLKPLVELSNFRNVYGKGGIWAFLFQYLYYLFESILLVLLVALGQYVGELFSPHAVMKNIPLGGIFCALTWGMLHGLSKDFETAVLCIGLSALFGAAYLLSRRNMRYAYAVIALIFLI